MRGALLACGFSLLTCLGVGQTAAQVVENQLVAATRHLAGSVHEITVLNGRINMLASVGHDGVLLVDTGYGATAEEAKTALDSLDGGPVRIIINSHGDPDHLGGNAFLGPEAVVVAHRQARRQAGAFFALPTVDTAGLPQLLVTAETTLRFNGESIRVVPIPGGHTAGDLMIHFVDSGVAAVGDIVLTGTFPDADPGRGGDARRLVQILESLQQQLPPETILVPGHGETMRAEELHGYLAMIEGSMAALRAGFAEGQGFDEALASGALNPWAAWVRPT